MVDGRILLDAGAPLLPHMRRLDIDPGGIEAIFITHFHADHILGLPSFILHRLFVSDTPLTIVGPPGVEHHLESLFAIVWLHADWAEIRKRGEVVYQDAGASGEVAGVAYTTVALDHGSSGCTGYRLNIGGRLLAYSGDTDNTPPIDELVRGAEVAIVEATAPGRPYSHLGFEEALALRDRHPGTRFFFNHVYEGTLDGAAADFQVVEV
ncbi:MAG: hypothetical protein NVS9B1_18950 [Candidatus Dormibacteraceae bacterium]